MKRKRLLSLLLVTFSICTVVGAWVGFNAPHQMLLTSANQSRTAGEASNGNRPPIDSFQELKRENPSGVSSSASISLQDALPDRVFSVVFAEAKKGDPIAMRQLGEAMWRCAGLDKISVADYERRQIDLQLEIEAQMKKVGAKLTAEQQARNIAGATTNKEALDEACAKIDQKEVATWLQWLERAANTGDLQAKRDYVHTALSEFRQRGVQLTDLDEAVRRRDLVAQFSKDLLRQGDCNALSSLEWATPDRATGYAYRLALAQWLKHLAQRNGGESKAFESFDQYLAEQTSNFSPEQVSNANSVATNIVQNYCGAY